MKRADIKCGYRCNNNCRFCVVGHKKNADNRPTEELKKELREAKKTCDSVVLTGGEVTIRPDILDIVRYAKQIGFKAIQIQTNGRMLAYKEFCKALIAAGANEFGLALHGHTAELHDLLTRSKGSFDQTVQGIKNLKSLGSQVITNTVVVKQNYQHLPKIAKLLVKLGVDQFQFAFVHPLGNAWKNYGDIVPSMSKSAEYIHKGMDIGIKAGISCMAEAVPYCMMKGYENFVSEQHIPNTEIRDLNHFDPDFKKTRITQGKKKFPQCKQCKHNQICEGPWREYPERYGAEEFKAVR